MISTTLVEFFCTGVPFPLKQLTKYKPYLDIACTERIAFDYQTHRLSQSSYWSIKQMSRGLVLYKPSSLLRSYIANTSALLSSV